MAKKRPRRPTVARDARGRFTSKPSSKKKQATHVPHQRRNVSPRYAPKPISRPTNRRRLVAPVKRQPAKRKRSTPAKPRQRATVRLRSRRKSPLRATRRTPKRKHATKRRPPRVRRQTPKHGRSHVGITPPYPFFDWLVTFSYKQRAIDFLVFHTPDTDAPETHDFAGDHYPVARCLTWIYDKPDTYQWLIDLIEAGDVVPLARQRSRSMPGSRAHVAER